MRIYSISIILMLSCVTSSSKSDSSEDINDSTISASCETDPVGITPQYSCDSTTTTGQCVDYLEGFDTSTMDTICSALQGNATLGSPCDVPNEIGRCCQLLNGQWLVTHYSDDNSTELESENLQSYCQDIGGNWYQ